MRRLACVSIDLDELVHYARIHGLPEGLTGAESDVLRLGGQRFAELMDRHGLQGTVFAIGETLRGEGPDGEAARAALKALADAGHEIGNHTFRHVYGLAGLSRARIDDEIARGAAAIEAATGTRPLGFRAPGYNVSETLFAALAAQGYTYDASVFPSAPYYAARASVIGALRLAGRPSQSHAGRPEVLLAPTGPYRPDPAAFWRQGHGPLVELPVATVPLTGIPFIGTSVTSLPFGLVQAGLALMARRDFVSLELHGIDLMDSADGIPAPLVRRQRDLAIPLSEKRRRLDHVLSRLEDGWEVVPLLTAARETTGIAGFVEAGGKV